MSITNESRPWYKVRWQIWIFAVVGIPMSFLFTKYVTRIPEVAVTSGPVGQNRTLEERMTFVAKLEKSFHARGWPASIDLEGEEGKVLKVYWEKLDPPMVRQLVKSQEIVADIREFGFKSMVLRSDKKIWDINLKNHK